MKKNILGKFTVTAMMMAALILGVGAQKTPLTTSATNSSDFDCVYGVNDKTDSFLANGYGSTEVITYTEAEATAAGIPAGFTGDVVSVLHSSVNSGIMLDFSSQNIPIQLVKSITFRVYINDDGINDGYPEIRIPEPYTNGGWVMRYKFADKTDAWQDIVLQDGNGSFFDNGSRIANFNMLAKDGYLYKMELALRYSGTNPTFYIDSVKLGFVDNDGVAPVLNYNGEDVVTLAQGERLNFDVSAVDAIDGKVDVDYVWGDPSKINEDGTPMAGTHTLTFTAKDFFGNTAEKTITVIVEAPDTTPPTLVIPVDTIYAKVGARSLLTFTATDDSGSVELTTTWSEGALDRYERLTKGTHTLTITASDLSGNQTQKVITFIVTEEGDTADVIIDEETLYPDPVEPDSSEEESSEEISSSEEESSEEVSSSEQSSEEPASSEEESSVEEDASEEESNEEITSSKESASSENSEVANSEKSEDEGEDSSIKSKPGCGSVMSVMTGLPILALGACVLFKRKKD